MIPPPDKLLRPLYWRMSDPQDAAVQIGSASWLDSARVLKDSGRTSVLEGELDGQVVIVKTMRLRRWRDLPSRLLRRTRLSRQLRGATLLEHDGIATAAPLLLVRGKRSDLPGTFEALVLEKLEGRTLLRVIADGKLSVRDEHALAESVGRLTARLDQALINNRDHKPSNIIVQRDEDGAFRLAIIDTVHMTTKNLRVNQMSANLAWELIGTNLLPRRAILMRVLMASEAEVWGVHGVPSDKREIAAESLKNLWRLTGKQIRDHGDCTPKDDPLA